jgi:hypothetical protein
MQDWQHSRFEKALADGEPSFEYDWPLHSVDAVNRQRYRVCLLKKTQTNISTGNKDALPLLRLDVEGSTPIWQWFVELHGQFQPISFQDW